MPPPFRPPRAAQATPRRQEGGDHSVRVEAERGGGLRRHGGRNGHEATATKGRRGGYDLGRIEGTTPTLPGRGDEDELLPVAAGSGAAGSSAVAYGSFLARTASGKQETDAYADA